MKNLLSVELLTQGEMQLFIYAACEGCQTYSTTLTDEDFRKIVVGTSLERSQFVRLPVCYALRVKQQEQAFEESCADGDLEVVDPGFTLVAPKRARKAPRTAPKETFFVICDGSFCPSPRPNAGYGIEEEQPSLIMYAVLFRLFYITIIDVSKVFATIEEWRGNTMTWGKLDREGKL